MKIICRASRILFVVRPRRSRPARPERPGVRGLGLDTEPNFLDIFDFPLLAGSRSTVPRNSDSIPLMADLARRIFGSMDPWAKPRRRPRVGFTVTGVLEIVPEVPTCPSSIDRSSALRNSSKDPKGREMSTFFTPTFGWRRGNRGSISRRNFRFSQRICQSTHRRTAPLSSRTADLDPSPLSSLRRLGANGDVRTTTYLALLGLFTCSGRRHYMNIEVRSPGGRAKSESAR